MSSHLDLDAALEKGNAIAIEITEHFKPAWRFSDFKEFSGLMSFVARHMGERPGADIALDYFRQLRLLCVDVATHYERLSKDDPTHSLVRLIYGPQIEHLYKLTRALAYQAQNKTSFALPDESYSVVDLFTKRTASKLNVVVARMLWLEERRTRGLELYPNNGRFASLDFDDHHLAHKLNEQLRKEYVNPPSYVLLEWVKFLGLLKYPTYVRSELSKLMHAVEIVMRHQHNAHNETLPCPLVDTYTTPCTAEAAAAPDEHDRQCYACLFKFADTYSDDAMTEPAVRSHCGHVHGAVCLDIWVKEGFNSCPPCRQDLFDFALRLKGKARKRYLALVEVIQEVAQLDEEVDGYLYAGAKDVFEPGFGELLFKLADLGEKMAVAREGFLVVVQTLYNPQGQLGFVV